MANSWFQKASVQTAIVSGIGIVLVTVVVQWGPKTRLEGELTALQKENQRLETELAPFRAIAFQRFGGPEGQALAKLAAQMRDLQAQLERSLTSIGRLDVEIVATLTGKWKASSPPRLANLFRTGNRNSDLRVQIKLSGLEARWLDLENSTPPNMSSGEKGSWVLDYRAQAPAGSWILGVSRDRLEAATGMEMSLYGIDSAATEDSMVTVQKVVLTFYVNGVPSFRADFSKPITGKVPAELGSSVKFVRSDVTPLTKIP